LRRSFGPSGRVAMILSSTEDPQPRVPCCSVFATTLLFGDGGCRRTAVAAWIGYGPMS
jgi:hypothetical protein